MASMFQLGCLYTMRGWIVWCTVHWYVCCRRKLKWRIRLKQRR